MQSICKPLNSDYFCESEGFFAIPAFSSPQLPFIAAHLHVSGPVKPAQSPPALLSLNLENNLSIGMIQQVLIKKHPPLPWRIDLTEFPKTKSHKNDVKPLIRKHPA
ncbi:hypothetical protein F0170_00355 [Pseudomonas sp. MAFF 730085]|uniref:Uncharacterized protein n=1 Tax=Pseudomonas kitaguniensis TaxID=2607908 RepID=A0A5N7JMJ7_9PSED|nr:hypothetical protein [Pseudomonas kitaguniensis]MPQ82576.1 hypothetical protein [Pseudomonas kitaguniensis]